jgi:hypothetical protein
MPDAETPDERLDAIRRRHPDSSPEVQHYLAGLEVDDEVPGGGGRRWLESLADKSPAISLGLTLAVAVALQVVFFSSLHGCGTTASWAAYLSLVVLVGGGLLTVQLLRNAFQLGCLAATGLVAVLVLLSGIIAFNDFGQAWGLAIDCSF